MPTLVKDPRERSPFWICCYTSADGRRLKKSTKQTDRRKAWEVCLAIDRAEAHARSGTLTEARARDIIAEILQRTSGEKLAYFTVEEWVKHWLEGKKQSKSPRTADRYEQICDEFLESLGGRAKLNIAAITSKDILTFRKARMAKGLTPSTTNLDVKIISGVFNSATRQGYIPMNPCAAVESLPSERIEKGVFTREHIKALMKAAMKQEHGRPVFEAGADWRGAILLSYYTGARLQDVANIQWDSIDLPNKLITYTARKTKERVLVPIHPDLEAYLLSLDAPDSGKAFVFPKLARRDTAGRSGLSRTFARIMARAKIAGELVRDRNKQGRTIRSLTFHSLRHSFNSEMANAGVGEELRMKLTGHATREEHKKYTHHELAPLRAAINKLPALE